MGNVSEQYVECVPRRDFDKYRPKRNVGEYTRVESEVNIKLLYIPLIQISTETEKIHLNLTEEDY